jgi:hypothetical protein
MFSNYICYSAYHDLAHKTLIVGMRAVLEILLCLYMHTNLATLFSCHIKLVLHLYHRGIYC